MKRGELGERRLLRIMEIIYLPVAILQAIAQAFWRD